MRASLPTPFVLSRQPDRDGVRYVSRSRIQSRILSNGIAICYALSRLRAHLRVQMRWTCYYPSPCVYLIERIMITNSVCLPSFCHTSWLLLLLSIASTGTRRGLAPPSSSFPSSVAQILRATLLPSNPAWRIHSCFPRRQRVFDSSRSSTSL